MSTMWAQGLSADRKVQKGTAGISFTDMFEYSLSEDICLHKSIVSVMRLSIRDAETIGKLNIN